MNNDAKERLRNVARRLTETAFWLACDDSSSEEEYQESLDALVNHLTKVRKRTHDLHAEEIPA